MSNTSKGYVYVLTNPAQQGLVKIGKTTKAPEERVKELSSATGVATPFTLIFHRQFNNCHIAEKTAHQILEDKGLRFNDAREFFTISINDAIHLVQALEDSEEEVESEAFDNDAKQIVEDVGNLYYKKGLDYYEGRNGCFQDSDKALECFIKAANSGYKTAYQDIGSIHEEQGDIYNAIQAYQEGVKLGNTDCCAQIAIIYSSDDNYKNDKNAELAWGYFFTNLKLEQITDAEVAHIKSYLFYTLLYKQPINQKWLPIIKSIKKHILDSIHIDYKHRETYSSVEKYLTSEKRAWRTCLIVVAALILIGIMIRSCSKLETERVATEEQRKKSVIETREQEAKRMNIEVEAK